MAKTSNVLPSDVFFHAANAQNLFPGPSGAAFDAPPGLLVGSEGDTLPTPFSPRSLGTLQEKFLAAPK